VVFIAKEWLLAGSLCLILFGWWISALFRDGMAAVRKSSADAKATKTRARAQRMLEARGFRVLDSQVGKSYQMTINGKVHDVSVKFGFLAERSGQTVAAEVKASPLSTGTLSEETRRQVLECQLASGCKRVLLIDPDNNSLTEVSLPLPPKAASVPSRLGTSFSRVCVAIGFLMLAALVLWPKHH
jgi:hypothetical protein